MSWENELKPEIKFTSPDGAVFYALWRDNERSRERKLGIFSIPNFDGDIVQDLGSKSTIWPLTVYFSGPFHHKEAESFWEEMSIAKGQWSIIHPTKGFLSLQLISFRESISPVENGNYTEFETSWIEPANQTNFISFEELISSILSTGLNLVEDCQILLAQIRAIAYSAIQAAIQTFNKVTGFMDSTIAELTATDAIIQDSYLSAKSALNNAIGNFSINDPDTEPVGTALAALAVIPVESSTDFNTRFSAYENFITEVLTLSPETTTGDDYNTVLSQEYGLTMGLLSMALIVSDSVFNSRQEIISAIEKLTENFNNSIAAMDAVQDNFSGLSVDFQYYSQSTIYTSLAALFSNALSYLLTQFYNLKAEKIITIKKIGGRSPLEITVTEYGSLGENDLNYDLFLASNNLSSNDILLLPYGREVVIYVG